MPLDLKRRPRSPNWVIRGTLRGIRVEESTGTSDRRIAEEIRAKREVEILRQSVYGRAATATFAAAALSFMENGGSKRFLEPVILHFGTSPLIQIDQDAIDRGALKLFPKGKPASRVRLFYAPVSAVLHHAAKRGWCPTPVIKRPKLPPGRVRWLEINEADRLISSCNVQLAALVIFMLYTGARVGEALWLDWRNVDLTRRHVTFEKTKNGEARGVPLHRRVVIALSNIKNRNGEVFRRPDGRPYSRPRNINDTSAGTRIKTAFKGACRRAGIENFRPHDCRHTWATWHYRVNRDLPGLQKLGGWKTVNMVMRYAHANVGEQRHTIDRLPGGKSGDAKNRKAKRS